MRPPSGFRYVGRFAVIPPQPQAFGQPDAGPPTATGLPGSLVSELDDVFVRGSDVVVLQQGSTLNNAKFAPPKGATAVAIGMLGQGQLLIVPAVATVSAEPNEGRTFVRLSGSIAPDELVGLARSLVRQPGGTLSRLHGKGSAA